MDFLISNLLSALIGLIFGVLFEEWLIRLKDNLLSIVRKPFRQDIPILAPFQFAFGPIEVPFVIFDGDGQAEYTPETIICHYDATPISLPSQIETIKRRMHEKETAKKLAGEPYSWNGLNYTLKHYTRGRTTEEENLEINLWFGPSDYYTFLATNMSLDKENVLESHTGKQLTLREKYFADYDWSDPSVQPIPPFSSLFGVVISLITSDDWLFIVKRPQNIGARAGVYNIAINEAVQRPMDRLDYTDAPNFYRTVARGATEELNLELGYSEITFFAFGADCEYSMWNILGVARTGKTAQEIMNLRRLGAKDKWEGKEVFHIPFTISDVVKFVANNRPWSPGALACVYYTLVHRFQKKLVDKAINQYPFPSEEDLKNQTDTTS